jgi:hypothetical protein
LHKDRNQWKISGIQPHTSPSNVAMKAGSLWPNFNTFLSFDAKFGFENTNWFGGNQILGLYDWVMLKFGCIVFNIGNSYVNCGLPN